MKKLGVLLAFLLLLTLCGCGKSSDMPFNGEISFHDVTLTIPEKYIRDSTQSTDDSWLFERGWYSAQILLVRKDAAADPEAAMESYRQYLTEQGADSQKTTFLGRDALRSTADQNGKIWREVFFYHNGSSYAVALRGGTEEEFQALLKSVGITE